MAKLSTTKLQFLLSLTLLAVVGALIPSGHSLEVAAQTSTSCNADSQNILAHCTKYVGKTGPKASPSVECCAAIKPVDVACACTLVTRDVEGVINMDKAVFVARSCGISVPQGTKCGSYTIPPP